MNKANFSLMNIGYYKHNHFFVGIIGNPSNFSYLFEIGWDFYTGFYVNLLFDQFTFSRLSKGMEQEKEEGVGFYTPYEVGEKNNCRIF